MALGHSGPRNHRRPRLPTQDEIKRRMELLREYIEECEDTSDHLEVYRELKCLLLRGWLKKENKPPSKQ